MICRKRKCYSEIDKNSYNCANALMIFIVADIWNCYNMGIKKTTNLEVVKETLYG